MTVSLCAVSPAKRRPARKPIIGITPSFDRESERPLISGRPLLYVTQENVRAIRAAGGHAVILPMCLDDEAELLDGLDGLLVTGTETPLPRRLRLREQLPGLREQNPERYDSDTRWLRGALDRKMPVLAICHGMQMLNEIFGGSLWPRIFPKAESDRHAQTAPPDQPWHPLHVLPGSLLASALGVTETQVNSFHVQAVRRPGDGVQITGFSADGVVEAIECPGYPFVVGVQFHPERLLRSNPQMLNLFKAFVSAAAAYAEERRADAAAWQS